MTPPFPRASLGARRGKGRARRLRRPSLLSSLSPSPPLPVLAPWRPRRVARGQARGSARARRRAGAGAAGERVRSAGGTKAKGRAPPPFLRPLSPPRRRASSRRAEDGGPGTSGEGASEQSAERSDAQGLGGRGDSETPPQFSLSSRARSADVVSRKTRGGARRDAPRPRLTPTTHLPSMRRASSRRCGTEC